MPILTIALTILDANIISTNVIESTEPIHAMDEAYGLGQLVRTEGVNEHRIWRSVHGETAEFLDGNIGNSPLSELDIDNPVHWGLVDITNKYRIFDGKQSSKSNNQDSIQYVLGNGLGRINTVSLLGISGASSVTCLVEKNGTEIYNTTKSLTSNAGMTNLWRYFFWPRRYKKSVNFSDITPITNSTVTLTVNGEGNTVGCGMAVLGNGVKFDEQSAPGVTTVDYGAANEVRDFSIRQELPTGDYYFKKGQHTIDGYFTFMIKKELYDLWNETVADIGSAPFLFTATNFFDSTNLFGIFGKARSSIDYATHCRITTEIKGLI